MTPLYSIIIPHYNSEDGLKKLLSSIPNKDSIEVIVIDDRSTSVLFKDVIEKSHLVNINGYINNGRKGAGAARNIGLEKAQGDFLIFADSDDFFTEDAFGVIDNTIKNSKDSNDIYFFNVTSQNLSGETGHRHMKVSSLVLNYIKNPNVSHSEKIKLTHNVPWGKVFNTSFIKRNEITFDETLVANDVMFSARAGKLASKFHCSDKIIYCVTQGEATLTSKKSLTNYWLRLEVYTRYYHFLNSGERKLINASPLPLLLTGKKYGFYQMFKSIFFLKRHKVCLFKYLSLDRERIIRAFKIK